MRPLICAFIGLILILSISTITTGTTTTQGGFLVIYHGFLLDVNGNPVGPGYYTVIFRIFAEPVGGTPLWQEAQLVEARSDGMIWAELGPISTNVMIGTGGSDSAIADRYLELQPSWSDPVLPRVQIVRGSAEGIASISAATAVSIDTNGDTIRLIDTLDAGVNANKALVTENRRLTLQVDSLRKLLEKYRPSR